MLTLDKTYHAAFTLKDVIRQTDLIRAPKIGDDCEVYLRTGNLQVAGSFKVRGAYHRISRLSPEEKEHGATAYSAGGHTQGVALTAAGSGIQSCVCTPNFTSISKMEATHACDAQVGLVDGVYDDAYRRALQAQEEADSTFIHSFNDEDMMADQGTISLEILSQLPDVDAVIMPVDGGGLASGVVYTIKSLSPNYKVYGVQSSDVPSVVQALAHHQVECLNGVCTIADDITVKQPGDLAYSVCDQYVDEIATAANDEVSTAILTLIEQQKLIAEGAGAVSVATALFNKLDLKDKGVVCLVSDDNIDVTILPRIINRGLLKVGRSCDMTLELVDKPNQFKEVLAIVADMGGNMVAVRHSYSGEGSDINGCTLRIVMETRSHQHIKEIRSALLSAGYQMIEH